MQFDAVRSMPDLLTTDEAADYLRLSERKLYALVADRSVPCTKVTGRWLFPKAALDRWIAADLAMQGHAMPAAAPPIVGGSHDPLLEWALRESRSCLANLPEGSEAGLGRLARGEVALAAIHLHRLDGDDATANPEAVDANPALHDAVVIAFARRHQGLLVAPGNPLGLSDMASVAATGARLAQRPAGAGAQLLLIALLARAGLAAGVQLKASLVCPTGSDLGQAIRSGRADCGIASLSVAEAMGLAFLPLVWEHFDLVIRQRDYFMPGPQRLFALMRSSAFRRQAEDLKGYDVGGAGEVRTIGPN
jgi:putative molybdopterin biosynthesis protein